MGIPNVARILGQTCVLVADDGGRRGIGRCGHGLLGKAGMDGEQCHYQQHQSAAQQADIRVEGVPVEEIAAFAETLLPGRGGIGRYPPRRGRPRGWVHLDVRSTKARWTG